MKKKLCFFILLVAGGIFTVELSGVAPGTAQVSLRPSHVYISSDTSQGAVLVTLSGYLTDEVRYRLFNGSSQYACWNNLTHSYITSTSYSSGPNVPGTPSTSSTFWIIYQRGTNSSVTARYRDRLGPEYSVNNKTIDLPAATAIRDSFILSGTLLESESNKLSQKFVVLAWNGTKLVSASPSRLNSGFFSIYLPAGTTIDRIEVRTLDNISIAEINGSWETFSSLEKIQLTDNPVQDSKLSEITLDGQIPDGFNPGNTHYTIELPSGTTKIPVVKVTLNNVSATVLISEAVDLTGDETARTTRIVVTAADGISKTTYKILFNPLLEVASLAEFRTGDTSRIYLIKSEILISFLNEYRNQKFIQDSTAAIMIDDPNRVISTIYSIGDIISNLKAKLNHSSGSVKLIPLTDPGTPVSSGNEPIPLDITIAQIYSGIDIYEGKLVKLTKVRPFDAGSVLSANTGYTVSDGSDTLILNAKYGNLDYIGIFLPGLCDLSGIVTSVDGIMQITPRFVTDIYVYDSNASLVSIRINGDTIPGFVPDLMSYAVTLPAGTETIPEIIYTPVNNKVRVQVIKATDLYGDETARTCTLIATAEDGSSIKTYTLLFSVYAPDSDASLSDLSVNGETVHGFNPGILGYSLTLPGSSEIIPFVNYTTTEPLAAVIISEATNLKGTPEERTTTIIVTAEDGVSRLVYSILFSLDKNTGILKVTDSEISIVTLGRNEIPFHGHSAFKRIKILDITGKTIYINKFTGNNVTVDIASLKPGFYILSTGSQTWKFFKPW